MTIKKNGQHTEMVVCFVLQWQQKKTIQKRKQKSCGLHNVEAHTAMFFSFLWRTVTWSAVPAFVHGGLIELRCQPAA